MRSLFEVSRPTSHIDEDVGSVIGEKSLGAGGVWLQSSSQQPDEVLHRHLEKIGESWCWGLSMTVEEPWGCDIIWFLKFIF